MIASSSIVPDLVILKATVRTMDSKNPRATALAVLGNRIVAVGRTEAIREMAGRRTRVIATRKRN